MKVGTLAVALVVATISMYATVWIVRSVSTSTVSTAPPTSPDTPETPAEDKPKDTAADKDTDKDTGFEIPNEGPYPKVVVDAKEYNFGVMEAAQTKTHSFVFRNDGDAPLKLKAGRTTCKCTLSQVSEQEILPGKSAEIGLSWKPPDVSDQFRQTAIIHTNDPENRTVELIVTGAVRAKMRLLPSDSWPVGDMAEDQPATFNGQLFSPILDEFKITGIVLGAEGLSVEVEPMSAEALKALDAKSGYVIKATVQPIMPIGNFRLPLKIQTDVPEKMEGDKPGPLLEYEVGIVGKRFGPIRVFGPNWLEGEMSANLGLFDSRDGKKVQLSLLVGKVPEDGFKFLEVESDPEFLKVSIEHDPKFESKKQRYFLTIEFPPGGARGPRNNENPGRIKVKTNHPDAPQMEFQVQYSAY